MKILDRPQLINASQAGVLYGKTPARVAQISLERAAEGYEWPRKVGRQWLAPASEWEVILNAKKKAETKKGEQHDEVVTAAEASRRLNISPNWLVTLGKRSLAKGNTWPIKQGPNWIAPIQEWKKIEENPRLRFLKPRNKR